MNPTAAVASSLGGRVARYTVGLGDAVETVRLTVATAARAGYSAARISLAPAELGGVRIELSQTSEGLVARVLAEHPAAAAVLSQSAGELRSALSSLGIPLAQLDIGSSSGQAGSGAGDPATGGGPGGGDQQPPGGGDTLAPADATEELSVQLANGVLIDVLA